MPMRFKPELLKRLSEQVRGLLAATAALEREMEPEIGRVAPEQRDSACNLIHYLAVRRQDIRSLQIELGHLGLSSLGRLEAHVAAGLESVLLALARIGDQPLPAEALGPQPHHFHEGDEALARHTSALLGPARSSDAVVRIMVTLPTDSASDYALVRRLVAAGMDVARINTAHDSLPAWRQMAANVRAAAAEHSRTVRVLLDLAGPKLRTGDLEPGPEVIRVRPRRDARGVVTEPARVKLFEVAEGTAAASKPATALPVLGEVLRDARAGDRLQLRDAPGRRRELAIVECDSSGVTAEVARSVWFESGLPLALARDGVTIASGSVGRLPAQPAPLRLRVGDALLLTADGAPGCNAPRNEARRVDKPARIPCTLPEVLADVRDGERVAFDDGTIEGVVVTASRTALLIRIERTAPGGGVLRSDKGINFPDSTLRLPSLTAADLEALDGGAQFADLIGLSFVRTAADVEALHGALAARRAAHLGVVVKIETRRGFENLPQILLTGLRRPPVGVMVARGDLGVEVGFERMAEVQEQILWLCEAAHVPVIWATQVLEGLTKTGVPTRGEVTDAAMSARAECVMLNKGPYVENAIRFLDDVLDRMRDHHIKKTPMLRRLKVSEGRWDLAPRAATSSADGSEVPGQ